MDSGKGKGLAMIGNDMKRFAEKNGMKVGRKAIYGLYKGYAIALRDGWSRSRSLYISMRLEDEAALKALNAWLNEDKNKGQYWISSGLADANHCEINFQDTFGTIRKITVFLEDFSDRLRSMGARGAEVCAKCGRNIERGAGRLVQMGREALMLHETCAAALLAGEEPSRCEKVRGLWTRLVGALHKAG
jgi:hypothetical protein